MKSLQKQSRTRIIMLTVAIALGALTSGHLSHAATFTVDRGIDGSPGCTLRNILNIINTRDADPLTCIGIGDPLGLNDTILFSVSNITGIDTPLPVNRCVKINPDGGRVRLFGTGNSRLMTIDDINCLIPINPPEDTNVQINNISFSGGDAGTESGGALFIEDSDVKIKNSEFANNAARAGGAIYSTGSRFTVDDSVITNNSSVTGGAIFAAFGGDSVINNSEISGNKAVQRAGGIFLEEATSTINNSEISENQAGSAGGGAYLAFGAALFLNHTTVADNRATGSGGGIYLGFGSFGSSPELGCNYSTISGNNSQLSGGGVYFLTTPVVTTSAIFNACIIAGNVATDGADEIAADIPNFLNFTGASNLFGHNDNTSDTAFTNFTPRGNDIVATSDGNTPTPLASILLPLGDNGGATRTHALPEGSPAIDIITGSACTNLSPSLDQRGMSRPSGEACDIGAFELHQDTQSFFVIPVGNGKSVIISL